MKYLRPALALNLLFILVTGLAFPAAVTGVAQRVFPYQANGSIISVKGRVVGSELIGQKFSGPGYFHPRPSAAGDGYDANNSSGSNLGPTNPKLLEGDKDNEGIKALSERYRTENGLGQDVVLPADAVTRSASGLDPHISLPNARLQVARVARVRGMDAAQVTDLITQVQEGPLLGIIGEHRVNVLNLNLRLDEKR